MSKSNSKRQITANRYRKINCYYHNHLEITHFCLNKQCTLPLCSQCFSIHTKDNNFHKIIKYQTVKQQTLKWLNAQKQIVQDNVTKINEYLLKCKSQIMNEIDNLINNVKQKLKINHQINQLDKICQSIQKINNQSVKTIIQLYSQQLIHTQPSNQITINKDSLLELFKISDNKPIFQPFTIKLVESLENSPFSSENKQLSAQNIQEYKNIHSDNEKKNFFKQQNQIISEKREIIVKKNEILQKKRRIFNQQSKDNIQKKPRSKLKSQNHKESWKDVVKTSTQKNNSTSRLVLTSNNQQLSQKVLTPQQLVQVCQIKRRTSLTNQNKFPIKHPIPQPQNIINLNHENNIFSLPQNYQHYEKRFIVKQIRK